MGAVGRVGVVEIRLLGDDGSCQQGNEDGTQRGFVNSWLNSRTGAELASFSSGGHPSRGRSIFPMVTNVL